MYNSYTLNDFVQEKYYKVGKTDINKKFNNMREMEMLCPSIDKSKKRDKKK